MNLFLKRLVVFLFLLILLLSAADFLFSCRVQQSSRPSIESWHNLLYEEIDADYLIMGSSRAKNHIVPDILDSILNTSSYNLGMSGTRIDLQAAVYDLYLLHHRKPDVILLCVDIFSLFPDERVTDHSQFFPFFRNREFRKRIFPLIHFTLPERFVPLYRFYTTNELESLLKRYPKTLQKGYFPIDGEWDSPSISSVQFGKEEHFQAIFEQFIEHTSKDGIQLVFVLPPMYYEKVKCVLNLDEMLEYYTDIGKKNDIPLLNYYFSDISMDTSNFTDPNHLNRQGAIAFSDSLAHDLLKLKMK